VSTPTTSLQVHGAVAQQLIDKAAELWTTAGKQSDSAEGLGIDGRITLVHDLCDQWMKGWATFVECAIKGPVILPGSSQSSVPLPSENIEVSATTYPRQLQAKGPFVRVGLPNVTIPVSAIGFEPSSLPPGATQFRIVLKDDNYVGANYTGTVLASTQAVANIAPDEIVFTVGL
jgi:hypothetical protein